MATESGNPGRWCGVCGSVTALVMLFTILLTGCQSINPLPSFGVGDGRPQEARIRELMKWHSGRVEVYRDFRTVFTARAVYLSDEIQHLAVDWEARSKLMSPEERKTLEKLHLGEDGPLIKILVGFYTPEEKLNDLTREDSPWIPYLKNPDGTFTKATCLMMDEDKTRIYMRFLRWDLSWSKLYLLCFPYSPALYSPGDAWLTMAISGPTGQGEIRLQMTPPVHDP